MQTLPKQPRKRVVSKGEYVVKTTLAIGFSGGLIVCGLFLALSLLGLPGFMREDEKERRICIAHGFDCAYDPSFLSVAIPVCFCLLLISLCFWWATRKSWRTVDAMQPITRANTADLPAPESLVRASAKPIQEQEAVLLRAVADAQERHEEQLVRAMEGTQE